MKEPQKVKGFAHLMFNCPECKGYVRMNVTLGMIGEQMDEMGYLMLLCPYCGKQVHVESE